MALPEELPGVVAEPPEPGTVALPEDPVLPTELPSMSSPDVLTALRSSPAPVVPEPTDAPPELGESIAAI